MLRVKNKPIMLRVVLLSVIMLSVIMLSAVMLSVIMLSFIMLSVIMLNVFMLNVVAPLLHLLLVSIDGNFFACFYLIPYHDRAYITTIYSYSMSFYYDV
jgi:hypothetical protein